jgi:hypothetical protein
MKYSKNGIEISWMLSPFIEKLWKLGRRKDKYFYSSKLNKLENKTKAISKKK